MTAILTLSILAFIAYCLYAYRWSKRHPRTVCPKCNGTKRWVDEFKRYRYCIACDDEGRVIS